MNGSIGAAACGAVLKRTLAGLVLAILSGLGLGLGLGAASAEVPPASRAASFTAAGDIADQYADYCALDLLAAAAYRIRAFPATGAALAAITQGMLDGGYVLDRYDLPWLASKDGVGSRSRDYGLLLFRDDGWRNPPRAGEPATIGTRLRGVYLLPETATDGFHPQAVDAVLARIHAQLGRASNEAGRCAGRPQAPAAGTRLAAFKSAAAPASCWYWGRCSPARSIRWRSGPGRCRRRRPACARYRPAPPRAQQSLPARRARHGRRHAAAELPATGGG
ncbi:hypothetical protein OUZ56_018692 [Daphnia magna]|uniref:Uncharacterized protein n=1 Tax=Daphnia magna TaxID=35525 RepID=A0ABQ9Z9Q3_9CRUS|nr:hypothetical protein OUZ56_018692 [Daphnia magna]